MFPRPGGAARSTCPRSGQPLLVGCAGEHDGGTARENRQDEPAPAAANGKGVRLPRRARRAQLLSAALEVFVAQGYHAAAMDDIAERAGVSKPVLYQHFPGKLDLYLALLDQSCDQIISAAGKALESTDDNKQRVTATMHAFYDYVADAEGAFRLVFESDLTNEPAVRARVDRVTTECAKLIAHVIADDTGLPEEQSQLLAVSLVGHGPGQRPLLAAGARHDRPGRGRRAGRRPGLARHRWLPAHRRPPLSPTDLTTPPQVPPDRVLPRATPEVTARTRRSSRWRSRSACRTSPAS